MGLAPETYLRAGLLDLLDRAGCRVRLVDITVEDDYPTEIGTTYKLCRALAARTAEHRDWADLTVLLAGECNASVGFWGGQDEAKTGLIWCDAHGDFNTPETTVTGSLGGMPLATLTGRCWANLAATIPGFEPIAEERVIHFGGRDFDPLEEAALNQSALDMVGAEAIDRLGPAAALAPSLDRLRTKVDQVYVHIDWDVVNPEEVQATKRYRPLGGPSCAQMIEAVEAIQRRLTVSALCLTAYDPAMDPDGLVPRTGLEIISRLIL